MKTKMNLFKYLLLVVISGLVLNGCAAIQKQNTVDKENLLSAAGFDMHLANTPEKMAHLQSLPQHKLIMHQKNGKIYYIYADAEYSKALYVGNEKDYQRYENLSEKKDIAEMNENAAEMNSDSWAVWGPVW